jgi:hypothetical protein
MTDKYRLLLSIVAILFLAHPAWADDFCGETPVFDTKHTETKGDAAINFLKGVLDGLQGQGSYTASIEDTLHKYPNVDVLLPRISIFNIECHSIMADTMLTPRQQRDEVLRVYLIIFTASPAKHGSMYRIGRSKYAFGHLEEPG